MRPKVGGIYAQRETVPTIRGASSAQSRVLVADVVNDNGVSDGGSRSNSGWVSPLPEVYPTDSRRGVDHAEEKSTSGFMWIDSPIFGRIPIPTLDGDEAVDILQLPLWMGAMTLGGAYRAGEVYGNHLDSRRGVGPAMMVEGRKFQLFDNSARRLDRLARRSDKPRSRTTDWEKEHRSRWVHE